MGKHVAYLVNRDHISPVKCSYFKEKALKKENFEKLFAASR